MRIAVEGCAHGELEIIYATLQEIEKSDNKKVDLLICCGDFQCTRNLTDLSCMAVPDKYKEMCSFYKYYSGEKLAPVLTLFIGGNHEASNYLQELPYGGWVAPNIYYMGYASAVNIAGVRIAGISGIYKSQDWMQGHHERVPYNSSSIRSVYHIRNLEVFRLKQLSGNIDIFLSHDWPRGITQYGDEQALLRNKPLFKNDIEANALGNPACMELLLHHYPTYWFSAHLHCKFAALVPKKNNDNDENTDDSGGACRFLALDKCLPKRKFLQIVEIPHEDGSPIEVAYDLEWLTILYLTNHLLSVKRGVHYMPGQGGTGRWIYTPTDTEKLSILKRFGGNLQVPKNFVETAEPWDPEKTLASNEMAPCARTNSQTTCFCNKLGIDDPEALLQIIAGTKENNSRIDRSLEKSDSKDESVTFDDDTFMSSTLEDDEEGSSEDSSERISLLPLLSPEDANKSKQNETNLTEERSTVKNLNKLFAEVKNENIGELKDLEAVIDRVGETVTTIAECQSFGEKATTEPNCKKFKRRNHSMYSNTV